MPARIFHGLSTAAADPDMSTGLRSVGFLDLLSSTSAGPSVARLVSTPVCAASLRNPVRNAGYIPVSSFCRSVTPGHYFSIRIYFNVASGRNLDDRCLLIFALFSRN